MRSPRRRAPITSPDPRHDGVRSDRMLALPLAELVLGRHHVAPPPPSKSDAASALDAPDRPVDSQGLARTLSTHRAAMAHKLGRVRIVGVGATLLLSLVLWKGFGLADWAPDVAVLGAYLPVALAIYAAGRRSPAVAQVAGITVAFGD